MATEPLTAKAIVLARYPSAICITRRHDGKARFRVVYSGMLCERGLSGWCKREAWAWEGARRGMVGKENR